MPKFIITLVICIISILICAGSVLLTKRRISHVSVLPDEVLSNLEKEEDIKNLTRNLYVSLGCLAVAVINIFLPDGLLKFLIPIITIVVSGLMLSTVMEEVDALDIKKDDIDILIESKQKHADDFNFTKEQMKNTRRQKREEAEKKSNKE